MIIGVVDKEAYSHEMFEYCFFFTRWNKMKNEKYHTVGTVSKSYKKTVERGKIDTPNTTAYFNGDLQALQ